MNDEALSDLLARWTGFSRPGASFEPRLTAKAAKRVEALFQSVRPKPPSKFELHSLHLRAAGSWTQNQSILGLGFRDLRQLPWVLFYPPSPKAARVNWLGAKPEVIQEYQHWLENGRRTRAVLALLHEFLRVYPTDLQTFDETRKILSRILSPNDQLPPPSARRWLQRCQDYRLLDSDWGHGFVQDYLTGTATCSDYLREAGIEGSLARSQFLKSGIRSALLDYYGLLTRDACDARQLQRLLKVLEFESRLRFGDRQSRQEIAKVLLSPFRDRPPPAKTKKALQSFFLRHFGDPRLPTSKGKWSGIPEAQRRVVTQWLVERVLEQFLILVKETALDKHWRFREAFWRAFVKESLIDDIWFVLGSSAGRLLERTSSDKAVVQRSAKLRGASSDQSVLLLKMPGVTVVEWSHNGSCHMWLDGMPGVPEFYKQEYDAVQLRRSFPYRIQDGAYSQPHQGSPEGRWQDAIAEWLWENTGLKISRELYFPSRLRKPRSRPVRWWQ